MGRGGINQGWKVHTISARVFGGAGRGDAGCASVCWDLRSGRGGPCAGDPDGCLTFNPQKWWKWVGVSGSRRSLLFGGCGSGEVVWNKVVDQAFGLTRNGLRKSALLP